MEETEKHPRRREENREAPAAAVPYQNDGGVVSRDHEKDKKAAQSGEEMLKYHPMGRTISRINEFWLRPYRSALTIFLLYGSQSQSRSHIINKLRPFLLMLLLRWVAIN